MMGHDGGGPMFWMWGRRRFAKPDSGPPNSGLTGQPPIEEPPDQQGPRDLRSRWRNLRQSVTGTTAALPRVIELVWQASPRVTAILFVVTVIAGFIPAASAYTSKLLINAVVQGIFIHKTGARDTVSIGLPFWHPSFSTFNAIIFLAILQLAIFALIAFLSTVRNITQ